MSVTWEWKDSNTWKQYDGYTCGLLESAYQAYLGGSTSMLQMSHGFFAADGYEVDFSKMQQKNKRTMFYRDIQRNGAFLVELLVIFVGGTTTSTPISSSAPSSYTSPSSGSVFINSTTIGPGVPSASFRCHTAHALFYVHCITAGCDFCNQGLTGSAGYRCNQCNYDVCIGCARKQVIRKYLIFFRIT